MANWPPSPSVEDEATALAKEHGINDIHAELIDDHPIPSRGSADQMPVIVDSDTDANIMLKAELSAAQSLFESKRGSSTPKSSTFQAETGLPTPPSSDTEARGRTSGVKNGKTVEANHTPRAKSTGDKRDITAPRPSISRVHTNIEGDLQGTRSGVRRAPSPYSYTREAGTFKVDTGRYANETFLSTNNIDNMARHDKSPQKQALHEKVYDSSTDSERRTKKSLRFAEQPRVLAKAENTLPPIHTTAYHGAKFPHNDEQHRAGRVSSEDVTGANHQYPKKAHRSRSRQSNSASRQGSSAESSSTEDYTVHGRAISMKKTGSEGHPVRRRSVHKPERLQLEQAISQSISERSQSNVFDEDTTRHVYRVRGSRDPMTPLSITTPHVNEDYFGKVLHDNALRQSRQSLRSSVEESALNSAPNSPPRTPKGGKPAYRYEYVESPTSSPPQTPRQSRPPSIDDTYLRDLKAHTSLLSQATSTAAAASLAKKTSPQSSRSIANAIETTTACTSTVPTGRPRSRASSPQRERLYRSDTFTYGEQPMPRVTYPPVPQAQCAATRDRLPRIEVPYAAPPTQPQRNASWTGYDPQYLVHTTASGPMQYSATRNPTMLSSNLRTAPPLQRSRSANAPQEVTQDWRNYSLPACPRMQPTQGLRDWWTFRDMQELDLCPDCAHAVAHTRHRPLLLRSLDKPYDKWTICAMSRPWLRQAFVQSIKLDKSDLAMMKKVTTLPHGARVCQGAKPDVRTWWKLTDPSTGRAVPEFFACSACMYNIHVVFPNLPEQFQRDTLGQEKICSLYHGSKHFTILMEQLDQVAEKCREKGREHARYIQPFVDQFRHLTRYPVCSKDTLLLNRAWHYMNDLPEFTICEACFDEVVWPVTDRPIAREISRTTKIAKQSVPARACNTQAVGCQLYSERMRRLFNDVVTGRLSYESFKAMVVARHAAQYRLNRMNKMYEEDRKMGWDTRAEIEKNKLDWKSLE